MSVFNVISGMHISNQTWQAEYVSTFSHTRRDWITQANRACCGLGLGRDQDLKNCRPVKVDVSVPALLFIIATWVHNEAVIRMYESVHLVQLLASQEGDRQTWLCLQRDGRIQHPMFGVDFDDDCRFDESGMDEEEGKSS